MIQARIKAVLVTIILKISFFTCTISNAETIVLSSYHNVPPFVTGNHTGLTYDMARYMSKQQGGDFKVEVRLIPRKRLDLLLKKENLIVPWVTPAWFGPGAAEKYQWSAPILNDGSVYIWRSGLSHSFSKPSDLKGYRLGGILGYHYKGVDPLVDSGDIVREDTTKEFQLLKKLLLDRIDVGIIPFSGGQHLIKTHDWEQKFDLAMHHHFSRHFLINRSSEKKTLFIEAVAKRMNGDPQWHSVLQQYGQKPVGAVAPEVGNYGS